MKNDKKYILFYYNKKSDSYISDYIFSIDELKDIINNENKIILFQEIDDINDYYEKLNENFMTELLKIYDINFENIIDKIITRF